MHFEHLERKVEDYQERIDLLVRELESWKKKIL